MHCWARYLLLAVVAALGTGQMLAACGQKGNLYLPPPEAKAAASRPATPAQPEPVTPPSPQPQGAGEGLQGLDKVQTGEPDVSGM
jgi:predicted small lipoprotein YifL